MAVTVSDVLLLSAVKMPVKPVDIRQEQDWQPGNTDFFDNQEPGWKTQLFTTVESRAEGLDFQAVICNESVTVFECIQKNRLNNYNPEYSDRTF